MSTTPYVTILNPAGCPQIEGALSFGLKGEYANALGALAPLAVSSAEFLRGIFLLHLGQKPKALAVFRRVAASPDGHFLAPAFCDFLTGDAQAAAAMYGGREFTQYFRAVSESIFFRNMYQAVDNTVRAFPPKDDTFTIVDLGIGTARQVRRIVEWIPHYWPHVRRVHIIGVEPYDHLATLAHRQLEELTQSTPLRVTYALLRTYAQHLDTATIAEQLLYGRLDLLNACASIHHMRQEEKWRLLRVMGSWQPRLFIMSDADSDHESTLPDLSVELIANVTSFYTHLLALMLSRNADEETAAHYRGFCFYDARNILLETGERRIEFHTTADRWRQYLVEAGFAILSPRAAWLADIDASLSRVLPDRLITAHWERPLIFQLAATASGDTV